MSSLFSLKPVSFKKNLRASVSDCYWSGINAANLADQPQGPAQTPLASTVYVGMDTLMQEVRLAYSKQIELHGGGQTTLHPLQVFPCALILGWHEGLHALIRLLVAERGIHVALQHSMLESPRVLIERWQRPMFLSWEHIRHDLANRDLSFSFPSFWLRKPCFAWCAWCSSRRPIIWDLLDSGVNRRDPSPDMTTACLRRPQPCVCGIMLEVWKPEPQWHGASMAAIERCNIVTGPGVVVSVKVGSPASHSDQWPKSVTSCIDTWIGLDDCETVSAVLSTWTCGQVELSPKNEYEQSSLNSLWRHGSTRFHPSVLEALTKNGPAERTGAALGIRQAPQGHIFWAALTKSPSTHTKRNKKATQTNYVANTNKTATLWTTNTEFENACPAAPIM